MSTIGDHFISPSFKAGKASPGKFDDWVDIYEDRLRGWLFEQAEKLLERGSPAWPATLALALSFVEGYEMFRRGEDSDRRSKEFFQSGFRRIFSRTEPTYPATALDQSAALIYKELRCGLYHLGLAGPNVFFGEFPAPLELILEEGTYRPVEIHVDVGRFLSTVKNEFNAYVGRLRDPADPEAAEMRAAFERTWHRIHDRKI